MSKYGFVSGLYFPVPEKTPYLDASQAVENVFKKTPESADIC